MRIGLWQLFVCGLIPGKALLPARVWFVRSLLGRLVVGPEDSGYNPVVVV